MYTVKLDVRIKSLSPAWGDKLCVIVDGSNRYYYYLYRNSSNDLYLAYSTDGMTWTSEKLLIKAASPSSMANAASMTIDHANKKLYIVYEDAQVGDSNIVAVDVDCTTPTTPSLGTPQTISVLATNYQAPVCALGYDGGLHVGVTRFDYGGFKSNYYAVKSGISAGEPDLTSWSAIHSIGNNNSSDYYGMMKIVAHPLENRLVMLLGYYNSDLYRSLNTTGTYDGWMTMADTGSTITGYWHSNFTDSLTSCLLDMATIPTWGDAYFGICRISNYYTLYIYDFDGDTGTGSMPLSSQVNVSSKSSTYKDVGVTAIAYPGDFFGYLFFIDFDSGYTELYCTSYSYAEDSYTASSSINSHAGSFDDRSISTIRNSPLGLAPSEIIVGALIEV